MSQNIPLVISDTRLLLGAPFDKRTISSTGAGAIPRDKMQKYYNTRNRPVFAFIGFAKTWHLPHSHEAEEYQQFIPENGPTQWQREKAEYILKQAGINISCPCEQGIHHCHEKEVLKKNARGFCR